MTLYRGTVGKPRVMSGRMVRGACRRCRGPLFVCRTAPAPFCPDCDLVKRRRTVGVCGCGLRKLAEGESKCSVCRRAA